MVKRRKPSTIPSKPQRLLLMERRRRALQYRLSGATYDDIAEVLKKTFHEALPPRYTRVSAYQDVQTELKELSSVMAETREAVRLLELERLDALLLALWHTAKEGEEAAIDRVLKIMSRRAALLGLDAPAKIAETTPEGEGVGATALFVGGSKAQFIGALKQLAAEPEEEEPA